MYFVQTNAAFFNSPNYPEAVDNDQPDYVMFSI